MTEKGYHYTECGLDNVYLTNGYTEHETDYGKGVSIHNADNLHEAIARSIVFSPHVIRGRELRFLRSMLDLSQSGLGRVLGSKTQNIKRWEKDLDKAIPGTADRALRSFYVLKACGHELAERMCELLGEIDELEYQLATFQSVEGEWKLAA